jgi:hypothetical protein
VVAEIIRIRRSGASKINFLATRHSSKAAEMTNLRPTSVMRIVLTDVDGTLRGKLRAAVNFPPCCAEN